MPENAWNLTYQNVIGLCRLAYADCSPHGEGKYWRIGRNVWYLQKIYAYDSFRAIVVTGKDSMNNNIKIVAYAGSDDRGDWGLSGNAGDFFFGAKNTLQYNQGLEIAKREKPNYLVGHSLGGGIALYSSLLTSIRAATINPAPVIDHGPVKLNQWDSYPWAINYCVNYEILAGGRALFSSSESPGKRVSVTSCADPLSPIAKHLLNYLEGYVDPVEKK